MHKSHLKFFFFFFKLDWKPFDADTSNSPQDTHHMTNEKTSDVNLKILKRL